MSANNESKAEVLLELERAREEIAELKARCGSSGSGEELLKFENYFDAAGDPSSFIDSNYIYQAVNAAYSRYFGKPVEEIVGSNVTEFLGEEVFQSSIKPHLDRCLAGEPHGLLEAEALEIPKPESQNINQKGICRRVNE